MSTKANITGDTNRQGNSGKKRGGRGGKGRGKGRGGRGRSQGRGRGRGRNNERKLENKKAQNETNTDDLCSDTAAKKWLEESLENLGHAEPSSLLEALDVSTDSQIQDEKLVKLTMWLEDRIIRQWGLVERDKLRHGYWDHIKKYMDALECPQSYTSDSIDYGSNSCNWKDLPSQRTRVIHWLVSCAISEAFGDIGQQHQQAENEEKDRPKTKEPTAPYLSNNSPSAHAPASCSNELGKFPLGFSTGDVETDNILTLLRMQMLVQLEEDQKQVNQVIAQMQNVTAGKAKPLKQAKMRPNNTKPPPPPKKKQHNRKR